MRTREEIQAEIQSVSKDAATPDIIFTVMLLGILEGVLDIRDILVQRNARSW